MTEYDRVYGRVVQLVVFHPVFGLSGDLVKLWEVVSTTPGCLPKLDPGRFSEYVSSFIGVVDPEMDLSLLDDYRDRLVYDVSTYIVDLVERSRQRFRTPSRKRRLEITAK